MYLCMYWFNFVPTLRMSISIFVPAKNDDSGVMKRVKISIFTRVHGSLVTETPAEFQTGTPVSTLLCYIKVNIYCNGAKPNKEIWRFGYLLWFHGELLVQHLLMLHCTVLNQSWTQHKGGAWAISGTRQEEALFSPLVVLGEGKGVNFYSDSLSWFQPKNAGGGYNQLIHLFPQQRSYQWQLFQDLVKLALPNFIEKTKGCFVKHPGSRPSQASGSPAVVNHDSK